MYVFENVKRIENLKEYMEELMENKNITRFEKKQKWIDLYVKDLHYLDYNIMYYILDKYSDIIEDTDEELEMKIKNLFGDDFDVFGEEKIEVFQGYHFPKNLVELSFAFLESSFFVDERDILLKENIIASMISLVIANNLSDSEENELILNPKIVRDIYQKNNLPFNEKFLEETECDYNY